MKRSRRALAAVAFAAAAAVTGVRAPTASADGGSTAVVVIDTGANVRHAVIHFDGSISGIDALELAGANPATYGFQGQGAAVCALDGVGNPADQSCLVGPHAEYWAYYLARDGATGWSYSRGCACTTTVQDGDVEGWRYGTGAAPRASADFCAYVECPAPPPPVGGGTNADPVTGPGAPTGGPTGGSMNGQAGGQTGGTVQPGTSDSTDPGGGTSESGDPAAVAALAPAAVPTSTSRPRDGEKSQVEAAAVHRKGGRGGDDTSGSPTGVAIAAAALAATAGLAVWLRRRRSALG